MRIILAIAVLGVLVLLLAMLVILWGTLRLLAAEVRDVRSAAHEAANRAASVAQAFGSAHASRLEQLHAGLSELLSHRPMGPYLVHRAPTVQPPPNAPAPGASGDSAA